MKRSWYINKLLKILNRRTYEARLNDVIDLIYHPRFKDDPNAELQDFFNGLSEIQSKIEELLRDNEVKVLLAKRLSTPSFLASTLYCSYEQFCKRAKKARRKVFSPDLPSTHSHT